MFTLGPGLSIGVLAASLVLTAPTPASADEERTCRGLVATIVGTAGDDRLVGSPGPDVVMGLGGNDRLIGGAGDDVLCGGRGADDLKGGAGADRLYGGHDALKQGERKVFISGDLLEGGPGDDLLSPGFDEVPGRHQYRRQNIVSFEHSTFAVTVDLRTRTAEGEGSDQLRRGSSLYVLGSRQGDVLHGSHADDVLEGGPGDDTIEGRAGEDVLLDYRGDDTFAGGADDDVVISTDGFDTVDGGSGNDFMVAASRGPSVVTGGPGRDYISRTITEAETGFIDGGDGENQLELDLQLWFDDNTRTATLDAPTGSAVVTGEAGTHTTSFTGMTAWTLWGGAPWTFNGTEDGDFVQVLDVPIDAHGNGGDDVLFGGDRDDVLDGGDGTDAVWGGEGRNTCTNYETGSCEGYPESSPPPARPTAVRAGVPDLRERAEAVFTLLGLTLPGR